MPPSPRILVVAKDTIISALVPILQKTGCQIIGKYTSGIDGINKSVTLDPDLILMDTNPPGPVDGIDATRYIFQIFHYPVILLTDTSGTGIPDRLCSAQSYGLFSAPFDETEIRYNIRIAIYNHAQRKPCLAPYSVGDPKKIAADLEAVIILDTKGRIVFCNPYASWFIDLPDNEVMMSYWRNVLMLISDSSGEQIKDPIPEVLGQQAALLFDTNTAVVTKTGKRRKVRASIRPIKDDQGVLIGAVMKMREKPV